jgi:hypothetical protein
MNNQNHISESLEKKFWVKILKFFDADPGSGMEKIRIRDLRWKKFGSRINKHPGSATLVQFLILKLIRQDFINFFTNK